MEKNKEFINNFIKELPKLIEVVNEIKEESEGDVIKKYELEKKIEITEEMNKMNNDELQLQLEKMYEKVEETQKNVEIKHQERDVLITELNKGINIMKEVIKMEDNIKDIKEYDKINENNVNIIMNKIVDKMIDNENNKYKSTLSKEENEHNERIKGIEELRKKTTKNEIEIPKDTVMKMKYGSAYNNQYIVNSFNKLEEWSKLKYNQILYDSEIDGKSSEIFGNKILNH